MMVNLTNHDRQLEKLLTITGRESISLHGLLMGSETPSMDWCITDSGYW